MKCLCRLLSILSCRDNFKIMFDSKDSTLTVFQLLEMACIEMMKLSFALKGQEGSHRHVYYRMLWSECSHIDTASPRCLHLM